MLLKETLANGITLVMEKIPKLRSVSVGITIKCGSELESKEENGFAHFLEHLAFKGTKDRKAVEISEAIESIGGKINAGTSKEYTNYYVLVLDEHINIAIDLLSDIFLNSLYLPDDIKKEKEVILSEIDLYEDTPDERIHDLLIETVWPNTSLGYPVLGEKEQVLSANRKSIINFKNRFYTPENTIISIAGNFSLPKVRKMIKKKFSVMEDKSGITKKNQKAAPVFNEKFKCFSKQTNQNHLCLSYQGLSYKDERRYCLSVFSNLFGSTMSSRLFQEVREKRGLVYSIYSYTLLFKRGGLFNIYAGTEAKYSLDVVNIILKEIQRVIEEGISSDELRKAKENLKGNMVLGLESAASRMNWNSKSILFHDRLISLEETFKNIEAVTMAQIKDLACELFIPEKRSLVVLGTVAPDNKKELSAILGAK